MAEKKPITDLGAMTDAELREQIDARVPRPAPASDEDMQEAMQLMRELAARGKG